jgi:hypothetical protein
MVPDVNPQAFVQEKGSPDGAPRAALVAFALFALLGVVFSAPSCQAWVPVMLPELQGATRFS